MKYDVTNLFASIEITRVTVVLKLYKDSGSLM